MVIDRNCVATGYGGAAAEGIFGGLSRTLRHTPSLNWTALPWKRPQGVQTLILNTKKSVASPCQVVNHSRLQIRLSVSLFRYEPEYTVLSELALELNGERFTPDLCVYSKLEMNYQEDVIRKTESPLLAVEIVSPSQSMQDVVDKINDMLDAGVQSCWLVQPATETVSIFTSGEKPATVSTGTITDPSTDIEVEIDEIFDEG